MTTINTSSLGMYSSSFTANVKTNTDAKAAETKTGETSSVEVNLRDSVYQTGESAKAGASAPASPAQEQIEQIQKQIKEVQKQLLQQQQQLAAAQASKGSEEEKALQVMSLQQQIAGTQAQLATLQGALLTLMKGTVSTTA
ncbi:hypothetical protein [Pseudomonas caspiana]|uniref:Uncharacterized protein n=1 Tax=Pseudomonas caspiana TaxID=1451454 RepID=A0A1Y3P5J4_9PSED|nr:hypothetical protein [Pseudomonas caspiana]OUM75116.1 hypothetical protein AUC60_02620 [Pseudomonas caspiana]